MQEPETQNSLQFAYPLGCSNELRHALPFFAMVISSVRKAWNNESIPYPQHPKPRDLLNALAGLQVIHVQATSGRGAAQELERPVRLFSGVFDRLEQEQRTFRPVEGHA